MPSPRVHFTRKLLTDLQPGESRQLLRDDDIRGLTLDVTVNGVKTFRIYRKVQGRPEKITLGRFNPAFPESRDFPQGTDLLKVLLAQPELSVKMARRLADAVNVQLDAGLNPAETKRRARGELTLGELFERYITDHCEPQGVRTIDDIRERYERFIGELPDRPAKKHGIKRTKSPYGVNWHTRKLSTISQEEIRKLHIGIGKHLAGSTANAVLGLISRLFTLAIEWGEFSGRNPAQGIKELPETKRDRFLKASEMPAFWKALDEEPSEDFRDFVLLSLLAGTRRSNTSAMRWDEIDLEAAEWRIGASESKNKDAMVVVLVPEAMEILSRRRTADPLGTWVFPADSESGHMINPQKRWTALLERAGLKNLRIHDLRRSLGSWQARTGASLLIIGKSLGHKSAQATQIYARLDTDPVRESVERATSAILATRKGKPAEVKELPAKRKRA